MGKVAAVAHEQDTNGKARRKGPGQRVVTNDCEVTGAPSGQPLWALFDGDHTPGESSGPAGEAQVPRANVQYHVVWPEKGQGGAVGRLIVGGPGRLPIRIRQRMMVHVSHTP